jgi:hypothetical protein
LRTASGPGGASLSFWEAWAFFCINIHANV